MQAHRHLKLAVICTVALALPVSAAAGIVCRGRPAGEARQGLPRCLPDQQPGLHGSEAAPPLIDVSRRGACSLYMRSRPKSFAAGMWPT